MRDYGHPFASIRIRVGQLRGVAPNHSLLEFVPYVLGFGPWTDQDWIKYHSMFNPTRKLTMPEVDAAYCNAMWAAIHTKGGS